MQPATLSVRIATTSTSRNPLAGLSGLQPGRRPPSPSWAKGSQSPYGAKWLATRGRPPPNRGASPRRRNPLTGLSGLQPSWWDAWLISPDGGSQSPYGAKWFATSARLVSSSTGSGSRNPLTGLCGLQRTGGSPARLTRLPSRNPLTGLSGLQQRVGARGQRPTYRVAIPLRG